MSPPRVPFRFKRLKYVVSLRRNRTDISNDGSQYLGLEDIESWTGHLAQENGGLGAPVEAEGESLSSTFEAGDVLFGKLRPYLAKTYLAEFSGRCTTELLVMRPIQLSGRFLRYVCLWKEFIDTIDASTFGSKMPRADWDFIGKMPVPVPDRHSLAERDPGSLGSMEG